MVAAICSHLEELVASPGQFTTLPSAAQGPESSKRHLSFADCWPKKLTRSARQPQENDNTRDVALIRLSVAECLSSSTGAVITPIALFLIENCSDDVDNEPALPNRNSWRSSHGWDCHDACGILCSRGGCPSPLRVQPDLSDATHRPDDHTSFSRTLTIRPRWKATTVTNIHFPAFNDSATRLRRWRLLASAHNGEDAEGKVCGITCRWPS